MSRYSDFITQGFEQARLALTDVIGMTNAQLRPQTLGRGLKQRASGRLKQLEVIVRRLLTLMALALSLPPVQSRTVSVTPTVPDGVEIAHFPTPRRFALSAPRVGQAGAETGFPESVRPTCPVPAGPFLARLSALYRVLEHPEAYARRLARALARQRKAREPRPYVPPMGSAFRLRPELGLIATALPELLNAALEDWENSS